MLDRAEQSILNVAEDNNQSEMQNIEEVVHEAANHTYELSKQQTRVTGLRTGYPQLDNMTTGLHEDELIILAARPAMGKTAFALNIAQNVAVRGDNQPTVAIFSLEMGAESLVNRMLCAEGGLTPTTCGPGTSIPMSGTHFGWPWGAWRGPTSTSTTPPGSRSPKSGLSAGA